MPHLPHLLRLTLALPLLLSACAPALNEPTVLSAEQSGAICTSGPRVTDGGTLTWGTAGEERSLPAPYDITCPDGRYMNTGQEVTVQAPTLAAALARFSEDAFLLSYYGDLRVRMPEPDLITADPLSEVAEALRDSREVLGLEVTVTPQGGTPQRLLYRGGLTPLRFDPALPLTIRIRTQGTPNPWPTVTLDPQTGTVRATLSR